MTSLRLIAKAILRSIEEHLNDRNYNSWGRSITMIGIFSKIASKQAIEQYRRNEVAFPKDIYDILVDAMKNETDARIELPDNAVLQVYQSMLKRDHLDLGIHACTCHDICQDGTMCEWIKIDGIPCSTDNDKIDLSARWQKVLMAVHKSKLKLCYMILRDENHKTNLYLSAISRHKSKKAGDIRASLMNAMNVFLPGIRLADVGNMELIKLYNMKFGGAVTGIPTRIENQHQGIDQGLDAVFNGLHSKEPFAVVVIAEPISEKELANAQKLMQNMASDVHSFTQYTKSNGINENTGVALTFSQGNNMNTGGSIGGNWGKSIGVNSGSGLNANYNTSKSLNVSASAGYFLSNASSRNAAIGSSSNISFQQINQAAIDCEEVIKLHLSRLKEGEGKGFWKTGVYVLANAANTVENVMSLLSAGYAGDTTYIESIRTTMLSSSANNVNALSHIKELRFVPCKSQIGSIYDDFATPLTNEELSIAAGLPHREVAGLEFIPNVVGFAANPPEKIGDRVYTLGRLIHNGSVTENTYQLDLDQLTAHALIVGATRQGKTTTCKTILNKMLKNRIPFLMIEPTKRDYLDWALEYNRNAKNENKIRVFAPNIRPRNASEEKMMKSYGVRELKLNLFQPAVVKGESITIDHHLGRLTTVLTASLPMEGILPMMMGDIIKIHTRHSMDVSKYSYQKESDPTKTSYRDEPSVKYPSLERMEQTANHFIEAKGYDHGEAQTNIQAALRNRIEHLVEFGELFDAERSIDFDDIFTHPTVINLSGMTNDEDKNLLAALLMVAMWDYRESAYNKKHPPENTLVHLTLLEEAHRLIKKPVVEMANSGNAQAAVANMFSNMLSEIGGYGEGIVIVDQTPTAIIPNAIKNTSLKIVHRLSDQQEIDAVSTSLGLTQEQKSVPNFLKQGEAIVFGPYDNTASYVKIQP